MHNALFWFESDNFFTSGERVRRSRHRLAPEPSATAMRRQRVAGEDFDQRERVVDPKRRSTAVDAGESHPRPAFVVALQVTKRVIDLEAPDAPSGHEVKRRACGGTTAVGSW